MKAATDSQHEMIHLRLLELLRRNLEDRLAQRAGAHVVAHGGLMPLTPLTCLRPTLSVRILWQPNRQRRESPYAIDQKGVTSIELVSGNMTTLLLCLKSNS